MELHDPDYEMQVTLRISKRVKLEQQQARFPPSQDEEKHGSRWYLLLRLLNEDRYEYEKALRTLEQQSGHRIVIRSRELTDTDLDRVEVVKFGSPEFVARGTWGTNSVSLGGRLLEACIGKPPICYYLQATRGELDYVREFINSRSHNLLCEFAWALGLQGPALYVAWIDGAWVTYIQAAAYAPVYSEGQAVSTLKMLDAEAEGLYWSTAHQLLTWSLEIVAKAKVDSRQDMLQRCSIKRSIERMSSPPLVTNPRKYLSWPAPSVTKSFPYVQLPSPSKCWPAPPNSTVVSPYTYRSLGRGKIRVISLVPWTSSKPDHLECNINVVDLRRQSELQTYEAVSYAWGELDVSQTLYCDDHTSKIRISRRLHCILKRLAQTELPHGHARRLWIDALCINQKDNVERGHQVGMMSTIFRRASVVHVFLTDAMANWYESEWFQRTWGQYGRQPQVYYIVADNTIVIQELLLASTVLVHFPIGSAEWVRHKQPVDWDDLCALANSLDTTDETGTKTREVVRRFDDLLRTSSRWFNILTLLLKFEYAKCKDDRDRIFALIGLASDVVSAVHEAEGKPPIPRKPILMPMPKLIIFDPDYNLSCEQTYTAFAIAVLQSAQPYTVLQCAGAYPYDRARHRPGQPLPTWVPDWRNGPARYKPLIGVANWRAGQWTTKSSNIQVDGFNLRLRGARVGTIQRLLDFETVEAPIPHRVHHAWRFQPDHSLREDRTLFETDSMTFGSAPRHALQCDEVWLFPNATVPFVLRRGEDANTYKLVGDCYLQGAMMGQLAEGAKQRERDIVLV